MLFLQGTRDDLAEMTLLEPVVRGLGDSRRCISFRRPIIPSTFWRGRDGTTAR